VTDTELTFVLTSGGHNAGIVSEPGHPRRHYQVMTKPDDARYVDPDTWQAEALAKEGSWWPEWVGWLNIRSGNLVTPPAMGAPDAGFRPLEDAPGRYVHQN
jgi:polyhydroxyalkanoate synthase